MAAGCELAPGTAGRKDAERGHPATGHSALTVCRDPRHSDAISSVASNPWTVPEEELTRERP